MHNKSGKCGTKPKHFKIIGDFQTTKACVLHISRTGNTKRLGVAISELLKAPAFDIAHALSSLDVSDFDLLVIGTSVMGLGPAPEVLAFVRHLAECAGKKAILFYTYAIKQGGTL